MNHLSQEYHEEGKRERRVAQIQVSGIAVFTSKWSEQKAGHQPRLFLDIFVVKS